MLHTRVPQIPELGTTMLDDLLALAQEIQPGVVTPATPMFELGFDSLASLELATRIEDDLDVPCTIEDVLDSADLNGLAATLLARRGSGMQ